MKQGKGKVVDVLLLAVLVQFLVGCGSGEEPMVPVEGQVKHATKSLVKGLVVLHPDASKGNTTKHEPRGAIGLDGTFKVTTHPREGAPLGWYKVSVICTEPSNPNEPSSVPRWLIPERFGKQAESKLTLEVRKAAPSGSYDLDLK